MRAYFPKVDYPAMTFQEKYPKLFQFFAGYFPDADFEDLTDEEVVSNYLSDCYRSEISRKNLEMVKQDVDRLIADIKLY